jgi:hypothetical protein
MSGDSLTAGISRARSGVRWLHSSPASIKAVAQCGHEDLSRNPFIVISVHSPIIIQAWKKAGLALQPSGLEKLKQ